MFQTVFQGLFQVILHGEYQKKTNKQINFPNFKSLKLFGFNFVDVIQAEKSRDGPLQFNALNLTDTC